MWRIAFALVVCLTLGACDQEPVFDTSSLPAFRKSTAEINATLDMRDQRKLQIALMSVVAGTAAEYSAFAMANPSALQRIETLDGIANPLMVLDRMRLLIEGRSAHAVIQRVTADIDSEISRAEQQANGASKILSKVVVENVHYSWNGNGSVPPIVEFSVYNGSQVPISAIDLSGELVVSGNEAPLVAGDVNYRFPVMLQPGMEEGGKAAFVAPGPWTAKQLEPPSDASIRLTFSNAEDGDGKRLLTVNIGRLEAMRRKRDFLRAS